MAKSKETKEEPAATHDHSAHYGGDNPDPAEGKEKEKEEEAAQEDE